MYEFSTISFPGAARQEKRSDLTLTATSLSLETAVGPRQKVQDFESESLTIGVEHSQKGLIHLH